MELGGCVPQKGSWCQTRCDEKNQTLAWQPCLLFDPFQMSEAKALWSWWESLEFKDEMFYRRWENKTTYDKYSWDLIITKTPKKEVLMFCCDVLKLSSL